MVKVSVVLPVYNVEPYLRDCMDSIVNQTLTDIEIICVNDGSPDNSLDILNEYAAKDDRISVYDQENGGHAVATNRGIDLATGDYLFLMDSDDVLDLRALELTYEKAIEKEVDFVLFKAINYDDENDRYYETEVYSMDKIAEVVGEEVFDYNDIGELMFGAIVTPWSKLFKREFVMENNIRFPEGLIFEDNVFFYEALLSAKRIYFLKEFLFIRRWYPKSSTMNGDLRFLNSIDVANLTIDVFKEKGEFDNYRHYLYDKKVNTVFFRYNHVKDEFKETFFKEMKKDFIKLLSEENYDTFMDSINYRNKKIFEQVLISENSIEFDMLRKMYDKKMGCHNRYLSKVNNNEVVKRNIDNFNSFTGISKEYYFNHMRKLFISLLDSDVSYNYFVKDIPYRYKKLFEQVIISCDYNEFREIRSIYDKRMRNNSLEGKLNYLNRKFGEIKEVIS